MLVIDRMSDADNVQTSVCVRGQEPRGETAPAGTRRSPLHANRRDDRSLITIVLFLYHQIRLPPTNPTPLVSFISVRPTWKSHMLCSNVD